MPVIDHRENSRVAWGRKVEPGDENKSNPTRDDIVLGCMLRIADGVEGMAKNVAQLESSLKFYKDGYQRMCDEANVLERRLAAQRGVSTRLRNKLKVTHES